MLCVLWFSGVSDETFSCFVQGRRVQLPSLMNGPSYKGYMRNRNVVQTIFFFSLNGQHLLAYIMVKMV